MVLIKNRLLIFLVFSRYRLACKCGIIFQVHYIIGSRIAFFDAWHTNFESRKAIIKPYFLDKRCFSFFFFFEVDFVLKIKDNLCLFAFSWREIRHKTRHYQGENSSIFINKMHKEYVIKKYIYIVNLHWSNSELFSRHYVLLISKRKSSKAVWETESFIYRLKSIKATF